MENPVHRIVFKLKDGEQLTNIINKFTSKKLLVCKVFKTRDCQHPERYIMTDTQEVHQDSNNSVTVL